MSVQNERGLLVGFQAGLSDIHSNYAKNSFLGSQLFGKSYNVIKGTGVLSSQIGLLNSMGLGIGSTQAGERNIMNNAILSLQMGRDNKVGRGLGYLQFGANNEIDYYFGKVGSKYVGGDLVGLVGAPTLLAAGADQLLNNGQGLEWVLSSLPF